MTVAASTTTTPAPLPRPARWLLLVAALGLWLVVLGGKLAIVERFGSDLPVWDQWDAEANGLFLPYLQDRLGWREFFVPHNEHRIACTKALALALLILNGQWDARLECAANAVLHGALAAACFLVGCRWLASRWRPVWWLVLAALTATPISWQNTIGGFHSPQIFLLWFSTVAIVLLTRSRAGSAGWWVGAASGALALISLGSGLVAPVAVAAVLAIDGAPRDVWRRHRWTLVVCAGLLAAGWLLRVEASQHDSLFAKSVGDFAQTLWRNLQWPVVNQPWFPLLGWLPWTWAAVRLLVRRTDCDVVDRTLVALGGWTMLQFLAAAYARGADGPWPASRYLDTVTFGIAVNAFIALRFFSHSSASVRLRWAGGGAALLGALLLGLGLWRHADAMVRGELPPIGALMQRREASTRAYLLSLDRRELDGHDIAYPNADVLIERLSHPEILAIMPASVRPPLALAGIAEPTGSFVPGALPPTVSVNLPAAFTGSFTADGAAAQGIWRSRPFPAGTQAYWRFAVAGRVGAPDMDLQLLDASSSAELAALRPRVLPAGGPVRTATIPAPRVATVLVARDASNADWMAFTGPVEIATGSVFVAWIARHSLAIVVLGIVLAAAALACLARVAPARVPTNAAS